MADYQTPILSKPPDIQYATGDVPPPSPLYVDVNDQLLLQAVSSIAGATVVLNAKLLLPGGRIVPIQTQVALTATRTSIVSLMPLQEGFLLGVTVALVGAGGLRGQVYVRAMLLRAYPASTLYGQVLCAAYCTGVEFPTWRPGYIEPARSGQGNIRSITGTTPAAGAEISEVVPTNATWRPILFTYTLTTSVTVANRDSQLVIDDGANELCQIPSGVVQAASLTNRYSWSAGWGAGTSSNSVVGVGLPINATCITGFRLRTKTINLQAADQYSAPQYLVEEWLLT